MDKYFGHEIEKKGDFFIYSDTKELVGWENDNRECGACGKARTKEGHDGCIGELDKKIVMNACCGHGAKNEAYIQFWNGERISGDNALWVLKYKKS